MDDTNEINTTDISNSTNKTVSNETFEYDSSFEARRMITLIERPILIVFGTVGNLITFFVMRRGSLKEITTCFYVAVLALADTGVLWTGGLPTFISTLHRSTMYTETWTKCVLDPFLFYFFTHYSSSLLSVMSVEKCLALYFPFKTKRFSTVRTAKWISIIIGLLLFAYDLQFIFGLKIYRSEIGVEYCYCKSESHCQFYYTSHSVIYSYAPFTIMLVANSAIIRKFLKAKYINRQAGTQSTNQALSKSASKGITMLITVSVAFIILTGPNVIFFEMSERTNYENSIVRSVTILLMFLNHTINCVLYCVIGSKFRQELLNMLRCRSESARNTPDKTYAISNVMSTRNMTGNNMEEATTLSTTPATTTTTGIATARATSAATNGSLETNTTYM